MRLWNFLYIYIYIYIYIYTYIHSFIHSFIGQRMIFKLSISILCIIRYTCATCISDFLNLRQAFDFYFCVNFLYRKIVLVLVISWFCICHCPIWVYCPLRLLFCLLPFCFPLLFTSIRKCVFLCSCVCICIYSVCAHTHISVYTYIRTHF